MSDLNKVSFRDITGKQAEAEVSVSDYAEAADKKITLSQLYSIKYPTSDEQPSALEQFAASAGIRIRNDDVHGIPASNMKEIMHGTLNKSAGGVIVQGTGSDRQTTAGRILYPEIMMQMINEVLYANKEDVMMPWESAIALRTSVSGARVDQPMVNVTGAMDAAAQPIAQGAETPVMVNITLAARSYTLPVKSIGLEIADQALEASTIDFVALMLSAQARGERIRRIEQDIVNIINGDADFGINAVTFANASTFGTLGGAPITHRAWVKYLRNKYQFMNLTHILTSVDSALDVEARVGRPTAQTDLSGVANRFPGDYSIENLGLPTPKVILLPDGVIGANRVVGFDSKIALHEITNVSASYSAIEAFVLRRVTGMRFDYSMGLFKLYDSAFTGLTLGA